VSRGLGRTAKWHSWPFDVQLEIREQSAKNYTG
jgi:hypothetical protein